MIKLRLGCLVGGIILLLQPALCHPHHDGLDAVDGPLPTPPATTVSPIPSVVPDPIPPETRAYWMKRALSVLKSQSPCPFAAFAAVVVDHSDPLTKGELICEGLNSVAEDANPTLHGEVAAINNCSRILQGPRYKLAPDAALAAFGKLSLYTTAEPCPMCAAAIRWAGFRECIYATSQFGLVGAGWGQIFITTKEVFARSKGLGANTTLVPGVLSNLTDPFFAWQYNPTAACPVGCARDGQGLCAPDGPAPVPDPPVGGFERMDVVGTEEL